MSWLRDIKAILYQEPETWLAYLPGQLVDKLPSIRAQKSRFPGLVLQTLRYIVLMILDVSFKKQQELRLPKKFFIYAATLNQMSSLDKTIHALQEKGESVIAISIPRLLDSSYRTKGYIPYQLTPIDLFRSMRIFLPRGPALYRELKKQHSVSVNSHFSAFCSVYTYLVYFHRVLSQVKPEFIITANDHNIPNRCMLAVAHQLGITTVYLQHASVSSVFPALRVNYAFLDGLCALDVYRQCELNRAPNAKNTPRPKVILSGQKKYLRKRNGMHMNVVGIALNALDSSDAVIEFVRELVSEGLNIRLRWHPGQPQLTTMDYREAFSEEERVVLSDPRNESVMDFMDKIGWLVAGNSSIHLEAAIAGVFPIYYELTPSEIPDYYGYVKYGLALRADSVSDVFDLISQGQDNLALNVDAVRYYSSTYLTEWEGREGDLVAECLIKISMGEDLPIEPISL